MVDRAEELLESGAILSRGEQGGFFVAGAVDWQEVFGKASGVVNLLTELEGHDGILGAVDDENRGADCG